MKKILLILLCLPMIGFGQNVNIPDANFKAYLVGEPLINTNGDTEIQVSEATAFNDGIYCSNMNISDLTGIEAFTSIIYLLCQNNQLSSLYLADNISLYALVCSNNQLTSLDFSNGNNTMTNWQEFECYDNPNLFCINVDDPVYSTATWVNIDSQIQFSNNCSSVVFGCSDALACNYDAAANTDDGSCAYASTSTDNQIHCDSYSWNGQTFIASGVYTYYTTNSVGCDSTASLNLTINNSTTSTETQINCDSYTWIDGVTYTASNNTATFTSTNAAGCTNIATLDLTINNSTTTTVSEVACDSYTWIDGVTYTASNNTATFTSTNAAGCNNIATLNLTINNSTTTTVSQFACDSYTWIDGVTYTASNNTATFTTTNAAGCTEINFLYLTIIYSNSSYDTLSVNASIVWNGMPLNASGDYSTTLINSDGCDSIVNLNLTVTTTGISDIANNKSNLIKITDMLGQETPYRRNTPLFYIYDDGTVEKRIVIE